MLEHCVKFEWKEVLLLLREIHHYLIEVYYASRMLESSVLYVGILCVTFFGRTVSAVPRDTLSKTSS